MTTPLPLAKTLRTLVGLGLLGFLSLPVQAQTTASVPCSVRIRSLASADYDHSTEVLLQGLVIGRERGLLLLRIAAGTVRVEVGTWEEALTRDAPATLEILAAKRQEDGRQRLVAREISYLGGRIILRDANGVPLQP